MTGYRDIFCILLFICIIRSVGGTTAVFCTDHVVSVNSKCELRSPNYDSKANYNTSKDCEISVNVLITQPYVVHVVQASANDCTERFRVLDVSKNPFTDQTTNCTRVDQRHIRAVDTYFRSGDDQTLLVQLPAGYAVRVGLNVSVFPIEDTSTGTTTTTKVTTTTSTTTTSTATTSTITTSTATTSTITTSATTSTTIPTTIGNIGNTASTTKNSNSSLNQKVGRCLECKVYWTTSLSDKSTTESGDRFSKPFLDNETNQIAVGVGAGGFLLIVIILVLACVLASRHRNRKRQDEKETIDLTTDATNGFALMTGERQSGVEQVDDNVGAASMAIPDYEYHSVEADSTVHGQQSTGNVQGRFRTTADRPHIEEEYATISKPFKQVELNDSRQSGNELAVQHQTGSEVDDREIYAEAPAVPVYMSGISGEAGEYDTAEEAKPGSDTVDSNGEQLPSDKHKVHDHDQVPSQADKQAASGDLAGGEEVQFVDNEFYSTGGGDWVRL